MSLDDEELAALVALAALPGIGPAALHEVHRSGAAASTWASVRAGRAAGAPAIGSALRRVPGGRGVEEATSAANAIEPEELLADHRRRGLHVLVHGEAGYPPRLDQDPAPPALLFVAGDPDLLWGPTVSVVGTRNATRLGCDTAAELALDLARVGVHIVSGLALGIDGAAHRAVVTAVDDPSSVVLGRPIAVVAAGLDRRYPRAHARLHEQVAACGAVVSEVPLGVPPSRWRFPARNRIIAGLGEALVVVESRSAGGSMLTVGEALARDRPVLAVPGHPSAAAAAGTLDLICDGATPLRDAEDVLVAIGRGGQLEALEDQAPPDEPLDPLARRLLEAMAVGPTTLADLVAASGEPLGDVSAALFALEGRGLLVRSGPWFELRRAGAGERRR